MCGCLQLSFHWVFSSSWQTIQYYVFACDQVSHRKCICTAHALKATSWPVSGCFLPRHPLTGKAFTACCTNGNGRGHLRSSWPHSASEVENEREGGSCGPRALFNQVQCVQPGFSEEVLLSGFRVGSHKLLEVSLWHKGSHCGLFEWSLGDVRLSERNEVGRIYLPHMQMITRR